MTTLTDFLLARFSEDEAAAHTESARIDARYASVRGASLAFTDWDLGPGNPARVLADCKAKRQIVELHADDQPNCMGGYREGLMHGDIIRSVRLNGAPIGYCDTLLALAAIYADHPDYQEAWRV